MTEFARVTDLGIGAHPDDLEIMCAGPIVECRTSPGRSFGAVVCTDGRRSPRGGRFAGVNDEELARIRRVEQENAAEVGTYAALAQLGFRSEDLLAGIGPLVEKLAAIIVAAGPAVVYTHEPDDSHATHVAVSRAVVAACRRLEPEGRPVRLIGCEGWRPLDQTPGAERADLEWDADVPLERALLAAHASQVESGPVDVDAELRRRQLRPGRHRTRAVDLSRQAGAGAR